MRCYSRNKNTIDFTCAGVFDYLYTSRSLYLSAYRHDASVEGDRRKANRILTSDSADEIDGLLLEPSFAFELTVYYCRSSGDTDTQKHVQYQIVCMY